MKMKWLFSVLALAITTSSFAEAEAQATTTWQTKIDAALNKFENRRQLDWSFTVKGFEDEEGEVTQQIETYQPAETIEASWTLVEVNGEAPSEERLKDYYERKRKRFEEAQEQAEEQDGEQEQSFSIIIRDLIIFDTLKLDSETETHSILSFDVNFDQRGIDAGDALTGKLFYDKKGAYIDRMEITNVESFSPAFSADIEKFSIAFAFQQIEKVVLPTLMSMNLEGTYAFFADIKEVSEVRYEDYRLK